MKAKKIFTLAMAAVLTLALLAGCGAAAPAADPTAAPATDAPAADAPVTEAPASEAPAALSGSVSTNGSTSMEKVVNILDRFGTLTKSLTDGIPAEIEARRAQYGYYRDRLLDFPRKAIGTEWFDGTRAAAKGLPTFVTVANSSRVIWAARRKIAGLNREAPSTFPQTLCIIIKGRARASAFAETRLEARISLFRAASASYVSRFPLHRLPLIRERLLRLGAHRRLLEGFRRLASASLGVLRGLACLSRFAT